MANFQIQTFIQKLDLGGCPQYPQSGHYPQYPNVHNFHNVHNVHNVDIIHNIPNVHDVHNVHNDHNMDIIHNIPNVHDVHNVHNFMWWGIWVNIWSILYLSWALKGIGQPIETHAFSVCTDLLQK